jgi:hypothetical protein
LSIHDPTPHDPEAASLNEWWRVEVTRRLKRLHRFTSIRDPELRDEALAADAAKCARDPVYWISQYGWLLDPREEDPVKREVPFVPWDGQVELIDWLLQKVQDGGVGLVNKGRELGISWTCLYLCYWKWRFEDRFGAKLGSRKEELVDDSTQDSLFGKLRYIHSKQPAHLRETYVKDQFRHLTNARNHSELVGEATNLGFARGGRKTVALVDEFAHIHPNFQSFIFTSLESVARTTWLVSTPNTQGDRFYQLFLDLPRDSVFEIYWQANPYKNEVWRQSKLLAMRPEEFAREHDGQFIAPSIGKIWFPKRELVAYNEETPEWAEKSAHARSAWQAFGGWDFGSGASLLCSMFALLDWGPQRGDPVLWIDNELSWKSTSWRTAGQDAIQMQAGYGWGRPVHYGDPAGIQRESDQGSWETHLQSAGVPLTCLGPWFNSREGIEWMIRQVQVMMDDGRLRVHERCSYLWSCLDNWRRDAPEGIDPETLNKVYVSPRKDQFSHGANALMYLVGGVLQLLGMGSVELPKPSELPRADISEIGEIIGSF